MMNVIDVTGNIPDQQDSIKSAVRPHILLKCFKSYVCSECINSKKFQVCFDRIDEIRLIFGTCVECRVLLKRDFITFSKNLKLRDEQ